MPLKIVTKSSSPEATVTKELKESGKTVAEETTTEAPPLQMGTLAAPAPWCQVGFEASYTHNLGNYQSARVAVSLVIPCQHGEIEDVFEVAKKWVNDRVEVLVGELTAD